MRISIIAAMAKNRVIGRRGSLPWHLPSDLRRFRELTMGHTLLMGRRTFEAIGRALPGRRTIVLSRDPRYRARGCDTAADIAAALALAAAAEELFVCGGAEVYRQLLPRAERIFLTEIVAGFAGDTFFPAWPEQDFERLESRLIGDVYNYRFSVLVRRESLRNDERN